jgi:hypothetical protein
MGLKILSKLGKIRDAVVVVYNVIVEIGKFINFLENEELTNDIDFIKDKAPLIKRGIAVVQKVLEFFGKIFKIELDESQVLNAEFDKDKLETYIEQLENLIDEK